MVLVIAAIRIEAVAVENIPDSVKVEEADLLAVKAAADKARRDPGPTINESMLPSMWTVHLLDNLFQRDQLKVPSKNSPRKTPN